MDCPYKLLFNVAAPARLATAANMSCVCVVWVYASVGEVVTSTAPLMPFG
jgi:hypothetical protein